MSVILENRGFSFGIESCAYVVRNPEGVIFYRTMRRAEAVAIYIRYAGY